MKTNQSGSKTFLFKPTVIEKFKRETKKGDLVQSQIKILKLTANSLKLVLTFWKLFFNATSLLSTVLAIRSSSFRRGRNQDAR